MKVLLRLLALLRKELFQLFRDPKTCVMLVVPPVMQILVLGYAATMDLKQVNFAVLDHCRTPDSRALIAKFEANSIFHRRAAFANDKEMVERFVSRDLKMGVVIPENFSRELAAGRTVLVQINVDGRNSNSGGVAVGYAATVIDSFNRDRAGAASPRITLQTRAWFNPNFIAQFFMVPAILATISLLDLLLLAALAVAREREAGTFDQLLLTPFASWEVLAGKAFSIVAVGLLQLTCGLLLILFWFRVPFHSSFGLLYLMFGCFVFATLGFGLLVSMAAKTQQQSIMLAFFYAVPCAMLSGLLTPVENMPKIFQWISFVNPIRHGIKALQRLFLEGATFADMAPLLASLAASGIAFSLLALAVFNYQRRS